MKITFTRKKEVNSFTKQLDKLNEQAKEASAFIKEIAQGNFSINVSDNLLDSELGATLLLMKEHLNKIAKEEQERNWLNIGLAKFSDILRNKASLDLSQLADDILANLVKYVDANQGAIFTLEDDDQHTQYLQMISCYAYNKKKYLNKRIETGEGLAGQCVLERDIIYLTEVPAEYINITSGLGEATPKAVLIAPLLINEKVFGVLELASFKDFPAHKIDFITKLSENIAATIKNVKDSERTHSLLRDSQQQTEDLRSQEEEMRQSMEELQATQDEMMRKSYELSEAIATSNSILNGINATMATIEFMPDGTIMTANQNFLNSVSYSLAEIKGKHHRQFVPSETLESEDYRKFWQRLAAGESFSGIFKRITSSGGVVWLNAVYNPMLNANGEVVKVMKFATDITAQQEMLAESKGILNGINSTMAMIEFSPEGLILSANENFLKVTSYKLAEIQGKHHQQFVPREILESEEYKKFWLRLAAGESFSGIFRRITSTGNIVWLNAIYSPILNAEGEVIKVIKFATDITAQQEMQANAVIQ